MRLGTFGKEYGSAGAAGAFFETMKDRLVKHIEKVLSDLSAEGAFGEASPPEVTLSIPKREAHGNFATNVALALGKAAGKNPREIAGMIKERLGDAGGLVARSEVAGPGFLNFFLQSGGLFSVLERIEREGDAFGRVPDGKDRRVLVEFVSANPTGPLHIGHGRGAVHGDALASVLDAGGFSVSREYYINDAGVQIANLGRSTFLRYRQLIEGKDEPLPEGLYQGDYVREHALALRKERGDGLTREDVPDIAAWTAARIQAEIVDDLAALGVRMDTYFSEKSLYERGVVDEKISALSDQGLAYEEDGALWFKTTAFGDEKDRVLVKSSGEKTYIAADMAYHADKFDRGFEELIDVWGADHHGYVARMKAAVQAMGRPPEAFTAMLVQMVNLVRSGERVSMSTRAGEFVTLRELVDEVGKDATRFFFLARRYDSQLDFDIDLAKEQSNKNPVFYVQYMHARVHSLFSKAAAEGVTPPRFADIDPALLDQAEEARIARHLAELPEVVRRSSQSREPHRLTTYLSDLAGMFHPYYFKHRILGEDRGLTAARLHLCGAVGQVARNALAILGISAPESM